ncbi:ECF RNA polymerase sigma factor SigK [Nocardia sp. CA-128927]|uniref:ECF RNA polymerase sigma factor SigK n=1 Tax=Nocardia sp. CA-128927 TaxID=3239975 RepID=UPI003D9685BC
MLLADDTGQSVVTRLLVAPKDDSLQKGAARPATHAAVTARAAESAELATLLRRCGQSDEDAFAELYDRTCARVFGVVLRVLYDSGYAEETTQEVYLQVWRCAATFDPAKGSAVGWLMTLAHRRAVDRVRAEQSASQHEAAYWLKNIREEFDEVSEEVERRLEQQAVLAGLASLTETQREAVSLAYYGGRTYTEVAHYLGIGLPTAKSRIRGGLSRLKKSLGELS